MPELPEVETMVRGLRPALAGRTIRARAGPRPVPAPGLHGRGVRAPGRRGDGRGASARRGKWVVIALGERPGIDRHPAADDGRVLARPARPPRARPPDVPAWTGRARRSGSATPGGWARSPGTPDPRRPRPAFARSHGPGRAGDRPGRPGRAAGADGAGDQADPDGPEGPGRDRQHLRRRDPVPGAAPPRAAAPRAVGRRRSAGSTRRSARSWTRRSRRRGRASTRGIAPCWGWRGASSPRTRCTAAGASPARRAARRSSRRRSPG